VRAPAEAASGRPRKPVDPATPASHPQNASHPSRTACDGCLRRSYLVGHLAARISALLDRRDRRLPPGLLALSDGDLIEAVTGDRPESAWRFLESFSPAGARERHAELEVGAVCRHSPEYPRGLEPLDDPPPSLFFVGDLEHVGRCNDEPAVAVVGARKATRYGLDVAYALGRGLGAARVTVVSGLALGIDGTAHRGVLDAGGPAIAVLAGGPNLPYPRSNGGLYAQIRERGVVISEMPPDQPAYRWSFPARNRIMAGLAKLTVLVEAADPSGSLITAVYAEELGREVGAVPGHVNSSMATGSNRLLREGAIFLRGAEDVLDELYGAGGRPARPSLVDSLEPHERAVLEAIEAGEPPAPIGGMPPGTVRGVLGRLELTGLVTRDHVGRYRRTALR
jgi:DNA processing protein